jgi:hypothetical protein
LGEVLNHKVLRTGGTELPVFEGVEEVLNHKVSTTSSCIAQPLLMVEEVLNHKVLRTGGTELPVFEGVEKILNENPTE